MTEMGNREFVTNIDLRRKVDPQLMQEFFKYGITEEYLTFYNANLILMPIYSVLLCQISKLNFEDVIEICIYWENLRIVWVDIFEPTSK